ncbi:MAG: hypothetical protein HY849_04480 [Nitrosomonadales bacterium]|nr:hypothetical protein [Nitrosomonadales bacterium]
MKTIWLQTIELDPQASAKPALGERCNGCGVCCAAEPCPVALVLLLQRRGRCRALLWQEAEARYVCGLVVAPHRHSWLIPARWSAGAGRLLATRIAAGAGCDSAAEVEPITTPGSPS